jgi:hypothetical protein
MDRFLAQAPQSILVASDLGAGTNLAHWGTTWPSSRFWRCRLRGTPSGRVGTVRAGAVPALDSPGRSERAISKREGARRDARALVEQRTLIAARFVGA